MSIFKRGTQKVREGLVSCSRLMFYFLQYNFDISEKIEVGVRMRKSKNGQAQTLDKCVPE